MMLKNESKKWARLKLLLALPLVTLAVYTFARPAMNPLLDVPANKSTEILPETKSVQNELDIKQDNPVTKQAKRDLVVMSMKGDDGKWAYCFPVSYDISIKNRDGIKTYIVDDKTYSLDEFKLKFTGYFVVSEEKDLPDVNRANVISFRCKTQSGLITPVWYLVKGTEIVRDNENSGVVKSYEEIFREKQNKMFEKTHGVKHPAAVQDKRLKNVGMSFIPPFSEGKKVYRFPVSYGDMKDGGVIKTYIVGNKSYTMGEFEKKFVGYITVFEEKELYDANRANIISFRCETQSGLTTPVWHLIKGMEMVRDESGVKKTYEKVYREKTK